MLQRLQLEGALLLYG